MRLTRAVLLLFPPLLLPATAFCGSVEIAGFAGPALSFYTQSFQYDPGNLGLRIPGVTIRQEGGFQLDTHGRLSFGAGITWYPVAAVGIEARIDTADVTAQLTGARYAVRVDLPAPLPPLTTSVDVGSGTAELHRLTPVSLGLRLRTPGRVRLSVSAGLSHLPELAATATQSVGLGVTGLDGRRRELNVATLALRAEADPIEKSGRFGVTVGAGLQIAVGPRLSLTAEGRYFHFQEHRLQWGPANGRPSAPLERALLDAVLDRLEPVAFDPSFAQIAGGVTLRF
jgi:opacity protein-like surface antigen